MINVIVTYTVKPEIVSENKSNIQKFLKDFKTLDQSKFEYKIFVKEMVLRLFIFQIMKTKKCRI